MEIGGARNADQTVRSRGRQDLTSAGSIRNFPGQGPSTIGRSLRTIGIDAPWLLLSNEGVGYFSSPRGVIAGSREDPGLARSSTPPAICKLVRRSVYRHCE